jgi:hypothetical protein
MWTLSEADDIGSRVLTHDDPVVEVNLLPADQTTARDAANKADLQRGLEELVRRAGHAQCPRFTHDDLDRLRAAVGGAAFQPPPTFNRVP